jgi:hypothetical protein
MRPARHKLPHPARTTALAATATLCVLALAACGGSSNSGTSTNGVASAPPALSTTATSATATAAKTAQPAAQGSKPATSASAGTAAAASTSSASATSQAHPNSPPVGGINVPTNAGTGTPQNRPRHPTQRFSPKVQKQYIEFTRCMRAHGVNLPEPVFSGGPVYGKTHIDTSSPGFAAAAKICRAQLVASASGG